MFFWYQALNGQDWLRGQLGSHLAHQVNRVLRLSMPYDTIRDRTHNMVQWRHLPGIGGTTQQWAVNSEGIVKLFKPRSLEQDDPNNMPNFPGLTLLFLSTIES